MMGLVEADVGTDQVGIRVVLDKCVNECPRGEPVNKLGADELSGERPVGKRDSILVVSQVHRQVIVRFDGQSRRNLLVIAVVKIAPAVGPVAGDLPSLVSGEISSVILEFVIAPGDSDV